MRHAESRQSNAQTKPTSQRMHDQSLASNRTATKGRPLEEFRADLVAHFAQYRAGDADRA